MTDQAADWKIRVSIGTEASQWLATLVLVSSILRRARAAVDFTFSWLPDDVTLPRKWGSPGWRPEIARAPKLRQGTKFSAWRWLVPEVYGFRGRAIYLDADQIVLADIGDLWATLDGEPGAKVAMVRNAVGVFGKKRPEPGKWQTSVMVLDCDSTTWIRIPDRFRDVEAGRLKYADLMQAAFVPDEIREIDPAWNHFGIRTPESKLVHFSHVKSQPWRNPKHPAADAWIDELRAAVRESHVTSRDVAWALSERYLHDSYKGAV